MVKVFNLSLHRSGTQSFHRFMQLHGFRAAHFPGADWEAGCADAVERLDTGAVWRALQEIRLEHDVFSDLPYPLLYREALAAYPDAKFLLVLRDVGQWTRSVRQHIGARPFTNLEKLQYWSCCNDRCYTICDYNDQSLEAIYNRHLASVTSFMLENHAEIRILWLDDRDVGRHCAEYLGFEMAHEFPSIDYHRSEVAQ